MGLLVSDIAVQVDGGIAAVFVAVVVAVVVAFVVYAAARQSWLIVWITVKFWGQNMVLN